jgi:hypothetical protein
MDGPEESLEGSVAQLVSDDQLVEPIDVPWYAATEQ